MSYLNQTIFVRTFLVRAFSMASLCACEIKLFKAFLFEIFFLSFEFDFLLGRNQIKGNRCMNNDLTIWPRADYIKR